MTRAAREVRAAEFARRGEQAWAAQAYLNLAALLESPLSPESRTTLERFLSQCPPSLTALAATAMGAPEPVDLVEAESERSELEQALLEQPRDIYPGRGGW